jgi:Helix-turn-helix domain
MVAMAVLVDVRTAASVLNVSTEAVRKAVRERRLKPMRRRPIRFSLASIEAYRVARQSRKHRQPCGVEIITQETN